ncbi:unnamed protein product, partial [Polarella glacialis]
ARIACRAAEGGTNGPGFLKFPESFVLGVATSAYQIEGAALQGGRKPSIWDDFSRQHGKTAEGATGDVACDHYHRFREDVRLMAAMGVRAYRFSISWSRLIPDGEGEVNEEGAKFYSDLIDALLAQPLARLRPSRDAVDHGQRSGDREPYLAGHNLLMAHAEGASQVQFSCSARCFVRNYFGPYFKIDNAKADIRDLDVGDLDDWESDMPMPFLEHVKEEKEAKSRKKNSVNMQDFSKDPMAFAAMGGGASGSSMAFVTLTIEETEKIGKAGTEKLSSAWTSMLENGGIKVQAYAVDPGSVLFVINSPSVIAQVKSFILDQPNVDFWELSQQRAYPDGRTAPLTADEERRTRLKTLKDSLPSEKPKPPAPTKPVTKQASASGKGGKKKPKAEL